MDNKRFWDRCSKYYPAFIRHSEKTYLQIRKTIRPFLKRSVKVGTGAGQMKNGAQNRPCQRRSFQGKMDG